MKTEESVVIYKSWFECLKAQGEKKFLKGMVALFDYSFYGADIAEYKLQPSLETILSTFTPVIDKNRRNRSNGMKGAAFGIKGGRPPQKADSKTPVGILVSNPDGVNAPNPTDTVTETKTETENNTVSVTTNDEGPHTDFDFFFPIFFFKNLTDPKGECQRFLDYYSSSDWTLQGGMKLDSDEKRISKARCWNPKVQDKRFGERFLSAWKALYDLAPMEVKQSMLKDKVDGKLNSSTFEIYCDKMFYDWVHSPDIFEKTKEILDKWTGEYPLKYRKIV